MKKIRFPEMDLLRFAFVLVEWFMKKRRSPGLDNEKKWNEKGETFCLTFNTSSKLFFKMGKWNIGHLAPPTRFPSTDETRQKMPSYIGSYFFKSWLFTQLNNNLTSLVCFSARCLLAYRSCWVLTVYWRLGGVRHLAYNPYSNILWAHYSHFLKNYFARSQVRRFSSNQSSL